MENTIEWKGTDEEIIEMICAEIVPDEEKAGRLFDFICKNRGMLDEAETFRDRMTQPPEGAVGMTFLDHEYYINVKISTVVIAALLLDLALTTGFASAAISIMGLPTKAFLRLEEREGQKCIVKETLLTAAKVGNSRILEKFKGECCNNQMRCRFQQEGCCACQPDDAEKIYQYLMECNMFRQISKDRYQYQW